MELRQITCFRVVVIGDLHCVENLSVVGNLDRLFMQLFVERDRLGLAREIGTVQGIPVRYVKIRLNPSISAPNSPSQKRLVEQGLVMCLPLTFSVPLLFCQHTPTSMRR
jgi:hypothetical protein